MQQHDLLREANRQLTICNACRYCEGYCAVFPALERRRTVTESDVLYLSNLCHDCRDCYSACMYAEPHEFDVNIPAVLSDVRLEVYERYASPRAFGAALRSQPSAVVGTVLASILLLALVALGTTGTTAFSFERGPGAFYRVIPYAAMLALFSLAALYVIVVWVGGALRFWRDTDSPSRGRLGMKALGVAAVEALTLRYLRGGGAGCDYPTAPGSYSRLVFHTLVFYGFLAAFAATIVAAIYQDIFGMLPPYPVLSIPVLSGLSGGIGLVAGSTGLLYLKTRSNPIPASWGMRILDYAFLVLLDGVAITGIALLVLRDSRLMAALLVVHLGSVLGLFLTAPYGKFVHFVYRTAALIQNQLEQQDA